MRASDLRRRIVLVRRLTERDELGQPLVAWTDYLVGVTTGTAKTITSLTRGESTTVFHSAAHGFSAGQFVTISSIAGIDGLPVTFGIIAADTNSFTVNLDLGDGLAIIGSSIATPVSGIPCSIEPLTAREMEIAGAMQTTSTHKITLRYHPLLAEPSALSSLRAICLNGSAIRIFELTQGANVDSRNQWVTATASETQVDA